MANTNKTLTKLEREVLKVLIDSASGNGDDFGFIEDAQPARAVGHGFKAPCGKEQLGGVVASLVKKGVIVVHAPVTTDSGTWTQFTWPCEEENRKAYVAGLIRVSEGQ